MDDNVIQLDGKRAEGLKPSPLVVKDENIYMIIANSNPDYDFSALSPEEQKEVSAGEDAFVKQQLMPILINHASNVCSCRAMEMQARARAKIQLMATPGPVQIELTQDDVDTMKFGIVAKATNADIDAIECIITNCKRCGAMHFFGNVELFTHAISEVLQKRLIDEARVRAHMETSKNFVMEDVETGETTECDDLGEALFGHKDENLTMTSADAQR